jgi:hypothetical protein
MSKLLGVLLALIVLGALPAVAAAQTPPGEGDTVSSGNTQDADIEQEAEAGGNGENGHHGSGGGNAGNQAAICQQNAGGDAVCDINQTQNFGAGGHARHQGHGGHHGHGGHGGVVHGVGGGVGGGVTSVALARTGFDAWILAALGGLSLAGGLGLLAAQRRGRLSA